MKGTYTVNEVRTKTKENAVSVHILVHSTCLYRREKKRKKETRKNNSGFSF